MGEAISLGAVQETLLIPLYGRARDAGRHDSILRDTRAIELVAAIDYDFAKFRGPSLAGSVLRASIFDGYLRSYLAEHPEATVVDLGCGLSTRFDRLDNGRLRWFDLDLPDTMALRRKFFTDSDRYTMIEGSILDDGWFEQVRAPGGPVFLLSEAVLLYFPAETVHTTLRQIARGFPGSRLVLDTGGKAMMGTQDRNPVFEQVSARMEWVCDDPGTLEPYGVRLLESRTFASPQPAVAGSWPLRYRLGMKMMRAVFPPPVTTYKLNLFETIEATQ
ncbi:class I SAM-dependent methyltransferase [Nocardia carnea]|uniref:class I SAM-dependent methyltransferase n=1 Tax=Nocardia carnea TaxID=37328 RepID=UPI00245620E6|nr:class I SAM-dependent methyltransferase [Nocardia carnea]